jgi:RNA polymerase sigma factor (sigma-70 family)
MTPLLSDARLARQATDGDQRAFSAIYRRYHQDLYRFCLSILGRPDDAQDALQNTMVKALRSLPGEERQIQLKPWLYKVAHNESIDLLRKRRDGPELDGTRASGALEIAETVALRERLERLLADLGALPERQRSALIMRELGGLGYEQIGEAFGTSISVARQTVYEARLNLRELEAGREMSCDQVTRQLSEADGRITRRRDIQAHLRACAECRAFGESIDTRRHDLAAISPLPAALAASILHGLAGGHAATGVGSALAGAQAATSGGGSAAAGLGAGAGKLAATSVALKAVATVAVVATVGVTAADRGGLIDAGLPGGQDNRPGANEERTEGIGPKAITPASSSSPNGDLPHTGIGLNGGQDASKQGAVPPSTADHKGHPKPSPPNAAAAEHRSSSGAPTTLPGASQHGQETAADHKASRGDNPNQGGNPSQGHSQSTNGHGHASPKSAHTGRGSSGSSHGPRVHSAPPKHAPEGSTGAGGNRSSKPPPPAAPEAKAPPTPSETPSAGDAAGEAGGSSGQTLEPSS